ncbi:hypothetical protein TNCV_3620211 [Trichonephila clavipes]|nr:hypothetical protein TNCV_3620211 [Trichonephila clavipes]
MRSRRPLRPVTGDPWNIIGSVDWIFADLGQTWSVTDWITVSSSTVMNPDLVRSLSDDDHRKRVWRRTSHCSDPAFIVERHTAISLRCYSVGATWDNTDHLYSGPSRHFDSS